MLDSEDTRSLLTAAFREDGDGFDVTSAMAARMYSAKGDGWVAAQQKLPQMLSRMLDARHPGLGAHVAEVADLSLACAAVMELPDEQMACIERAAQLHDIGKVAIPESIISKPARLSDDEWELMKQHTVIGERILAGFSEMGCVARIVRSSHERWDGKGYPDKLTGAAIPIGSRIIFVVDAFCAMTEQRAYCSTKSPHEAMAELRNCAGTQFDPAVVEAFASVLECRPSARAAEDCLLARLAA